MENRLGLGRRTPDSGSYSDLNRLNQLKVGKDRDGAENVRKVSELSERRANNMGATRRLNLELRRVAVLTDENERLRAAIDANWGADTLELAEQALQLPRFEAEIEELQKKIAYLQALVQAERQAVANFDYSAVWRSAW